MRASLVDRLDLRGPARDPADVGLRDERRRPDDDLLQRQVLLRDQVVRRPYLLYAPADRVDLHGRRLVAGANGGEAVARAVEPDDGQLAREAARRGVGA